MVNADRNVRVMSQNEHAPLLFGMDNFPSD
jgi:hypothetical protein